MKDYYSLYAFFHSAADPAMDGNKIDTPPVLKLTSPEDRDRIKALDAQLATVDEKIRKAIADFDYADPAQVVETIWFDDDFQSKGKQHVTGRPKKLITKAEGPVFSGKQALTRSGEGIAQDYVQGGISLSVPAEGTIFVHCYLDPANPPEALVLQFHIGGWNHRAVWGDAEKIPWGALGTADKLPMGPLPDTGKWVRLEVAAAKLGLKPGTKISGYAFTQFNGTVTWDRLGVSGMVDNSKDPNWSWEVWKKQNQGKRNNALPEGLRQLVRGKQPEDWSKEEARRLFEFWMGKFYKGARDVLYELLVLLRRASSSSPSASGMRMTIGCALSSPLTAISLPPSSKRVRLVTRERRPEAVQPSPYSVNDPSPHRIHVRSFPCDAFPL